MLKTFITSFKLKNTYRVNSIIYSIKGLPIINKILPSSLYKNKFLAFLGWAFEAIPVKRDEKDISAIKASLKDLKEGKCIALFPEGTRNGLEKGEKVKDGVAFFAIRSGAKVVPCGIKGGTKDHHKITISYGEPLDYSQYKGSKDKEVLDKVTEEIMSKIIELAS